MTIKALPPKICAEIWSEVLERTVTEEEAMKFSKNRRLLAPSHFDDFIDIAINPPHFAKATDIIQVLPQGESTIYDAVRDLKDFYRGSRT